MLKRLRSSLLLAVGSLLVGSLSGCFIAVERRYRVRRVTVIERNDGEVDPGSMDSGSSSTTVYIEEAPPTPPVIIRPACPGDDYIWVDGCYRWSGARYVWVSGYWSRPPRGRVTWVSGGYRHTRRGYVYVRGRWR